MLENCSSEKYYLIGKKKKLIPINILNMVSKTRAFVELETKKGWGKIMVGTD